MYVPRREITGITGTIDTHMLPRSNGSPERHVDDFTRISPVGLTIIFVQRVSTPAGQHHAMVERNKKNAADNKTGGDIEWVFLVKFTQSDSFHAGEINSLDPDTTSRFQITHLRNTRELIVTMTENPRQETPYMHARRDHEYGLLAIVTDLRQLKSDQKDAVYRITDTEAGLVTE